MNRGTIERRAAKVSLVTGLSTALTIVFQIIAVPVCLRYWGQESYGKWLAVFAAFMLLRSLDAGYVTYVGNTLNQLYHQNTERLREHMSSSVAGIALIGGIQLALSISVLLSDQAAGMLGLLAAETPDRLGLLVLITSWILSGSYLGIVHRLMIPSGLMFQAAWWSVVFQSSQFSVLVAAALLELSILHTGLLFALSQMVVYIASAFYVRKKLPAYYPWCKGGRISIGLKDLRRSMMLTVSNLIAQGTASGVVLLISSLAGPSAVPVYTTVRMLTNLWTTVTNVLAAPLLPDVVRYHVKGEFCKVSAINEAYWFLVGTVVNVGVLLTYPLLAPLYGYWTGHVLLLDTVLLCLLLGSAVATNFGALMTMYLTGINSLRIIFFVSSLRGVLALGLGVAAFCRHGVAGFGLGFFVAEVIVALITVLFFFRNELRAKGVKAPLAAFASAALGGGSVILFLMSEAFGWSPFLWSWPVAMAGVVMASVMGWRMLGNEVRMRLLGIIENPLL